MKTRCSKSCTKRKSLKANQVQQLQIAFDRRVRKPRPAVVHDTHTLTREIIVHVRKLGGWIVRVNVSGFYDPNRGIWRKGVTDPGCPDLLACLPGGLFLAVEVKTGTDRMSEQQVITRKVIEAAGGIYIEARHIEQFRHDLNHFKNK